MIIMMHLQKKYNVVPPTSVVLLPSTSMLTLEDAKRLQLMAWNELNRKIGPKEKHWQMLAEDLDKIIEGLIGRANPFFNNNVLNEKT